MNESIYRLGSVIEWFNPFTSRIVKGLVVKVCSTGEDPHVIINWERGASPVVSLNQYLPDARIQYRRLWRERNRDDVRRYQTEWARKKRVRLREMLKEENI